MMFCPKCGSILKVKKDKGKTVQYCSCGYKNKKPEVEKIVQETKKTEEIVVVDKDDESLPLTDADCPKCGHKKAFYWLVQTRAGDEPETKFLKCEKCKHVWRDYS